MKLNTKKDDRCITRYKGLNMQETAWFIDKTSIIYYQVF